MANEATVRCSLNILKRDGTITLIDYQSRPPGFTADVDGTKGPSPGAVDVSVLGTDIDLSELTQPGLCRFMNQDLDDDNYVEYGIYDAATNKFYPLGELLRGESFVLRLSRNLASEYPGTGTGTSGPDTNTLRFRAYRATCSVLIEIFEK